MHSILEERHLGRLLGIFGIYHAKSPVGMKGKHVVLEILRNEWRSGGLSGIESWISIPPDEGKRDQNWGKDQFQHSLNHATMSRATID